MGENCGQCLSIESKFECGYCKDRDSCIPAQLTNCQQTLQNISDVNQCERPFITDVRITILPTLLLFFVTYMYMYMVKLCSETV